MSTMNVQFGRLAFCGNELNVSRSQADRSVEESAKLLESLAVHGMDARRGVFTGFDKKSEIWKKAFTPLNKTDKEVTYEELLEDVYKARVTRYEALQECQGIGDAGTQEISRRRLEVFEALYTTNKDGVISLIKPDIMVNTGHSRGSLYEEAMIARVRGVIMRLVDSTDEPELDKDLSDDERKQELEELEIFKKIEPQEVAAMVPVEIRKYKTEMDRVNDQVLENSKHIGNTPPNSLNNLRTAKWYMDNDPNFGLDDIRKMFPGSTGNKCVYLLQLDKLWSVNNKEDLHEGEALRPNLKVFDRCFYKKNAPGYINFKGLNDVVKFRELVMRSSPSGLKDLNAQRARKGLDELGLATEQEIELFLKPVPRKQKGESKVTSQGSWLGKYRNGSIKILNDVAVSVMENKPQRLKIITENSELWNLFYDTLQRDQTALLIVLQGMQSNHKAILDTATRVLEAVPIESNGQDSNKKEEEVTAST